MGEAVARSLLDRGWRVVGIARRPAPIRHAAYRHIAYDLAEIAADATSLEAQLETHMRGVDASRVGLVNNAASPEGLVPLANLDPRLLARIYAVNAIAPLWLMGYVVRSTPSYCDFQARGLAVPPERPAADIVAFLEANGQPTFAEQRLQT